MIELRNGDKQEI